MGLRAGQPRMATRRHQWYRHIFESLQHLLSGRDPNRITRSRHFQIALSKSPIKLLSGTTPALDAARADFSANIFDRDSLLTGKGVTVGCADSGLDADMPYFRDGSGSAFPWNTVCE
jgi:subtilisin family serine protease